VADVQTTTKVGSIDLAECSPQYLGILRTQYDDLIAEREAEIAPFKQRRYAIEIEMQRRMDAENASILKFGDVVCRYDTVNAKPVVRETVLSEPGVIDELRSLLPLEVFEKAVAVREIPARTEIKTHLTYLKALEKCGDAGRALFTRIVDRGLPGRKFVIEREQTRVAPTPIKGVTP
jgi:hypothetical protein